MYKSVYKHLKNPMSFLNKIWNPELYHGSNKRGTFFEGWYYKNVSYNGESIVSIIPGVFKSKDKSKEHAFIQFIDGKSNQTTYFRFDINEFRAFQKPFEVQIGNCIFNNREIFIDIRRDDSLTYGHIKLGDLTPWPVTTFSPGAMGWYGFVPTMECNHGVLSMNHKIEGKLLVNDKVYILARGKGYIEKDWGKSFPSAYVWMQSNHFKHKGASFMASIARVPWIIGSFKGLLMGFHLNDKLYKFASYTGAKLEHLEINAEMVNFRVYDSKYVLNVKVKRAAGGLLKAPYEKQMLERVTESLNSEIELELYKFKGRNSELIFSDVAKYAGLEVTGDVNYLRLPQVHK
ncbi:MAG: hypothetical protein IAE98_00505 [Candidatus Kapabacteria bacterium]|nr:hypothetical protein [Candidatus Kapabacteria bacterium]